MTCPSTSQHSDDINAISESGVELVPSQSLLYPSRFREFDPVRQEPTVVYPAVSSWHLKLAMQANEQVTKVACVLARGDDTCFRLFRLEFMAHKELDLCVDSTALDG